MFSILVSAFDEFVISDIRVVGLQRVSIGSIFTIIPISVGDRMSEEKVRDIVIALFDTEQFNDIEISKDGTALIIDIEERPSISSIELEGNSALKSEDLLRGLEGAGIAEGQVYKRSTLEGMKSELVRQYASQGRYGAGVEVETFNKPRNTIDLKIIIDEGESAKIKSIKVIGNSIFSDDELLDALELSEGNWFSFLSNSNKYSKETLEGDIENLESFYLDRGYLKYSLESIQVSISQDRKDVFITMSILEGEKYTIDKNFLVTPEAKALNDIKVTGTKTALDGQQVPIFLMTSNEIGKTLRMNYAFPTETGFNQDLFSNTLTKFDNTNTTFDDTTP